MAKTFNITGTCRPEMHYMVDITDRVEKIRKMIAKGDYFCINRGRQYGKTTTLEALCDGLADEYLVLSMSFEGLGDSEMSSGDAVARTFVQILNFQMKYLKMQESLKILIRDAATTPGYGLAHLSITISDFCDAADKPVVLLIDEVDSAGNYPAFLQFLGMLRNKFLSRSKYPTFQSVILAGVYDVKNLKLRMRPEDEHQYNSPWNIAVRFDLDMSLSAEGIAGMLSEYATDHELAMDCTAVAKSIREYTGGYPFLVSRICMIMDEKSYEWNDTGVRDAVHDILMEQNTLFDDMIKKLDDFPTLTSYLKSILYQGQRVTVSLDEKAIQLGLAFAFVKEENGTLRIANRIIEMRLYNYFTAQEQTDVLFRQGQLDKSQFVHDGMLDMRRLLERFVQHFNEIYGNHPAKFIEEDGRKIFLLYLRPIINGIGNYYIEAETRDETRMDIVVDYLGHRYVVELKIWRGEEYNRRGEEQLLGYLEHYQLEVGYMLSFCFNQKKEIGVHQVCVKGRTLIEAIV